MERTLLRYTLCLFLLSATLYLGLLTSRILTLLDSLDRAVASANTTIAALPGEIDKQGEFTRKLLASSGEHLLQDTNRHLDSLQALLEQTTSKLNHSVALSVTELHQANQSITSIGSDLSRPIGHLDNLIIEADELTTRLNLASKPLLDCSGNGACLPSQTLALVGSARYTMGQIAKAAPETSIAVKQGAQSVAKIAEHISKKQPWYERVFGIARIISAAKFLLF